MKPSNIKGLIAAPLTPMHANGDVNLGVIGQYVDLLVEQEVYSVYVNGTNGEGTSLTVEERKQTLEAWIAAGKGKLNHVIAQVGTTNLKDTQELAKHAASMGADAIGVLPPFYFKPKSVRLLVDYLVEVSKAAPELPMLYYHFPGQTGVMMPAQAVLDEAIKRVPTICGVKFTDYDLLDFGRMCARPDAGNLTLAYGRDEQLACALLLGTNVAVGGTFNYCGKLYSRILASVQAGNLKQAAEYQHLSQKFIGVFLDHGFDVGINKSVMEMITGLPCGPPRLPLEGATQEKLQAIKADLTKIGFFQFRK